MAENDRDDRNYPDNGENTQGKLDPELSFRLKQAEFEIRSSMEDSVFTKKRILALGLTILILIILIAVAYFLSSVFTSFAKR